MNHQIKCILFYIVFYFKKYIPNISSETKGHKKNRPLLSGLFILMMITRF